MEPKGEYMTETTIAQPAPTEQPPHPGVWIGCKHCQNPHLIFVTDGLGFELLYGPCNAVEVLVTCVCGKKRRVFFG